MRTTKNLKTGYEVYFLIAAIDLRMKNKYKQTVNVMYEFSIHWTTCFPTNVVDNFPKNISATYQRGIGVSQATLKPNSVPKASYCDNSLY